MQASNGAHTGGPQPCPIATIGGVFKAGSLVTAPMTVVLKESGVEANLVPPQTAPVGGAILLAWRRIHYSPAPDALQRLAKSLESLS